MKKLHKNNKGFSLVELIISVAILSIVALPILQIFTLSASITAKSRSRGEATAAAQNIQETLEARGIENIRAKDSDGHMTDSVALSMLGDTDIPSEDTTVSDDKSEITIKGVSVGSKTFDAKVTLDRNGRLIGEGNSIGYKINDKPISQYTDMSGTFSQPYSSSQNPDKSSERDFGILYPGATFSSRRRVINVNAYSEPDAEQGGILVYVDITFSYYYTATDVNGKRITSPVNVIYNIFPSGKHIDSYDEEIACFLMYYAFYENVNEKEIINIYVDNEKADSDLKFKLFLIKQVPMVTGTNGILVNALDPTAGAEGTAALTKDRDYNLEINEYHNSRFNYIADSHDALDDSMMNVYTNANKRLSNIPNNTDLDIFKFSYRLKKPHSSGYFYFTKETIARNQLVKTEAEDRFFDVSISIYRSGALDEENPRPLYTLKANKLK